MKNRTKVLLVSCALALVLSVLTLAAFADDTAGSDLPVSESYVLHVLSVLDQKLTAKIDLLSSSFAELNDRYDGLEASVKALTEEKQTAELPAENETEAAETEKLPEASTEAVQQEAAPVSFDYTVECLTNGQKLLGNCEIILRSGSAEAVCPGANGISDLTEGADLADRTALSPNHLLLVPRDDGRGLVVTSKEAYVMVRGTYRIEG